MPVRRPGPNHSPHKRTEIATMFRKGIRAKAIAAEFRISRGAVYQICRRYKLQESAKDLPRSGRPPILDERDKRHIFRLIAQDPFIHNKDLLAALGNPCTIQTITKWLRKEGIQHFRAKERPKLTPELAAIRKEFAQKHLSKPLAQ